ncbi:methionyl-tRNA formyltransferase [Lachnospiraceae bacterium OM04-12BH]|nr:methionyl-tRNA formyltransferase [Lachnospiraceae bacterium OM04-12BH]
MKIIYMGTPDFAVAPLEAILKAGHEVTAVVTQPDRQKGRGREVQYSPVKECALSYGIPVLQPLKIKEKDAVEELRKYPADIFVVAAFGQLLSEEILNMPRLGCINIHASLLPAYRGAAPIQWCVINGEEKTGVTIMQMAKGMDTGDILLQKEVVLDEKETGGSLFDRLMETGAELIVEVLPKIEAGELTPVVQKEELATYAGKITKDMGNIDFAKSAVTIERLIRGLNPWPSAFTHYKGKILKIWEADVVSECANAENPVPGTVIAMDKESFTLATGEGALRIRSLQPEGKKRMSCAEFMRGYEVKEGEALH